MISEIKFRDEHKILHGLRLDFAKKRNQEGVIEGKPYKTIILAGENGCGKTAILIALETYITGKNEGFLTALITGANEDRCIAYPLEYIKYNVSGKLYTSRFDLFTDDQYRELVAENTSDKFELKSSPIKNCYLASLWIESDLTPQIFNRSSTQLQPDEGNRMIGDEVNSEAIRLFLIEINKIDAQKFKNDCEKNRENRVPIPDNKIDERLNSGHLKRFKDAFNNFFRQDSSIRFSKILGEGIFFEKNGKEFRIDRLSSGERQIVYKGARLLQNMNKAEGLVLIDEPELSMHPKWQKRILKYYQDLLSVEKVDENDNPIKNEKGEKEKEQTAQLIVATHSPYIIEAAMTGKNKADTLIIILKEKDGKIEPTYVYSTENGFCVKESGAEENDAPENGDFIFKDSPTPAEVNYIVFGISSPDYHQHLYAYLQVKKHKNILDIDTYIHEQIEAKIYENITKIKALGVNKDNFEKGMKDWSKKESWLKKDTYNGKTWKTLPTYIRNTIDHLYKDNENDKRHYTPDELEMSIELLRVIINKLKTEGGVQSS